MIFCPECRDGKPWNCAGFAFDENDVEVPCPTTYPNSPNHNEQEQR